MKKIVIKTNTGINENNLPSDIFAMIIKLSTNNEILVIDAEDVVVNDIINILQNFYRTQFRDSLRFENLFNGSIIVDKAAAYEQVPARLETQQAPNNELRPYNGTPTETPTNPTQTVMGPVDENETFDNDNLDENENEFESTLVKSATIPVNEATDDKKKILLARAIRNQLSSTANVISEKVTELNKILSRSIVLKNELDILMKPINESPKVNAIVDQITAINLGINIETDSLIKKVYINETGDISVLTKRLLTEKLDDDTVHDIGEMEIIISSMVILSENIMNMSIANPIIIKNLTHYVNSGDRLYSCGHVPIDQVCLGNVYEQIHKALVDKNILMLIELVIRFIRNPEINDSWGKYALGFPKVEGGNS